MSWILTITVFFIIFLLTFSLTVLRLRLIYRRKGIDDLFELQISIWRGLLRYKLEIPLIKLKRKKEQEQKYGFHPLKRLLARPVFKIKTEIEGKSGRPIKEEKEKIPIPRPYRLFRITERMLRLVKRYKPAVLYLLARVHLRHLKWNTEIGADDPARTGVLIGLLWGLKGFLLTQLYALFRSRAVRPVLGVKPCFDNSCFNIRLDCIFEVRIGYIIFTGFKAMFLKNNK